MLGGALSGPFQGGRGGPGGWWILDEPELHLVELEAVVPDLAGWRVERMPDLPEEAFFTLPPDWVCEVLSRSTERLDREEKLPLYADHGVRHAWLVDPVAQTLEVYALGERGRWREIRHHRGDERARGALRRHRARTVRSVEPAGASLIIRRDSPRGWAARPR